jgi:hypothetical protein
MASRSRVCRRIVWNADFRRSISFPTGALFSPRFAARHCERAISSMGLMIVTYPRAEKPAVSRAATKRAMNPVLRIREATRSTVTAGWVEATNQRAAATGL